MKSVLVIGMGRFGRHLAHKMSELGNDVMVVDKDEAIISRYASYFTDAQIADCTDEGVIRSLGVHHFDICFVTIGEDFQSSLVITALLKQMGAKYIVSKAKQDIQADLLKKIGASEVVCPEREIAEKLAVRYNANNIFDYVPLTSEFSIFEIPILKTWIGSSIVELNIRNIYKVNIIAVRHADRLEPMPGPNYEFSKNDHIIVIGKSTDVFKLTAM